MKQLYLKYCRIVGLIVILGTVFHHSLFSGTDAPVRILTLEDYVQTVLTESRDMQLAKIELQTADVVKKEALSTALPKFQLASNYNRNITKSFMYIDFPGPDGLLQEQKFKMSHKNDFSFTAAIQQPLFSTQIGTALKAAKEFRQMTELTFKATRRMVKKIASQVFYQALLLEKVWQVHLKSEINARENFQLMKKKFKYGQVSQFQMLQAESRWRGHIPDTTKAKKDYRQTINHLKQFSGIPMDAKIQLKGSFRRLPALPDHTDLESVLKRRADYNALLWENRLRKSAIQSAKGKRKPSFDLNILYRYSAMSDKFKLEKENNVFAVSIGMTFPIYAGGYFQAQIQRARIELRKSDIRIQKKRDELNSELQNIRLALLESNQRIKSSRTNLDTAQKAFEIAEIMAKNGLATQLELKDARLIFDKATLAFTAAAFDYLIAYFDWEYTNGSK